MAIRNAMLRELVSTANAYAFLIFTVNLAKIKKIAELIVRFAISNRKHNVKFVHQDTYFSQINVCSLNDISSKYKK